MFRAFSRGDEGVPHSDSPPPGDFYELLFNHHPQPLWVFDRETLRFLAVNDAAMQRYGFTREEFAEMTIRDIRPSEDLPALEQELDREGSGFEEPQRWRHLTKDGQKLIVEISAHDISLGGRSARLVLAQDVTEREKARAELERNHALLNAVVEGVPIPVYVKDREGRYLLLNSAVADVLGESRDDVVGRRDRDFLSPESGESVRERDERVMATAKASSVEEEVEVGGRRRVFLTTKAPYRGPGGSVEGIVGVGQDITERKQAEAALQSYNRRLANLWTLDQAILEAKDLPTVGETVVAMLVRVIDACSAARIVEIEDDGNQGRVLAGDVGPAAQEETRGVDRVAFSAPVLDELRNGTPIIGDPSHQSGGAARTRNGTGARVDLPLLAENRLIGVLSLESKVGDDLSDEDLTVADEVARHLAVALQQGRLRQQLLQHAEELEARVDERTEQLAESNAELESFAYTISHDLRAPLRAMEGFSRALLEDYGPRLDEEGREFAELIVDGARRMDELIRDLLGYSRLARAEIGLDDVSLDSVVTSALSQVEADLPEHVEIHVEEPLGEVQGHFPTLVQIAANLISNGVKFVPRDRVPRLRVYVREEEGEVHLHVQDNGIGIAPEHQDRIFRVFERLHTTDEFPGTGIGLATVRKGAERMGGHVVVRSAPGEGATFVVALPPPTETS